MTTLKAFVSSTFTDLKAHRARAIALLRGGGLHVDPMEDWSAASDEPKRFCLDRMKDCALCILLVAFRKGFIPDEETLSITQMEYQYATEHGIEVLSFLLDDGETNWPEEFDERETDSEIGRWRVRLRKKHGCGVFRADPVSLDIGPAVLRWVQDHQKKLGLKVTPGQRRARYPFVLFQHARLFGRNGDIAQFPPSKEEYAERRVHRPALADKVEERLKQVGWALVRGRGAAGKSVLAALIALGEHFRDKQAYYLDLASCNDDIDTASILDITESLDNSDTLFVIDNVHVAEEFASHLFENWQARRTGSALLMLGRSVIAGPTVRGEGSPLDHLNEHSLILQIEPNDLLGVLRRLLFRVEPTGAANLRPPADVLAHWHGLFGGDLIAFSAAVTQRIHSLRSGDWKLSPADAIAYVRETYFDPHTQAERAALLVVATMSMLELDTPSEAIDRVQIQKHIRGGIVHHVRRGRGHVYFRLVHPGLGDLLRAAETNQPSALQTFLKVAQRKPRAAFAITYRLSEQHREDEAASVWRWIAEAPASLVQGLTDETIYCFVSVLTQLTSRGLFSENQLDTLLCGAAENLVQSALRTPLVYLVIVLGYAERKLPGVHAAVVAGLNRTENRELQVQSALRTPLHFLVTFLAYAERKLPGVHAAVVAGLNRMENRELQVQSALRTPLGNLVTFLGYAERTLPGVYAAVVAAVNEPEKCQVLVRTALRTPLHFWPSFVEFADRRLPTVIAALSGPDSIETLARVAASSPPNEFVGFLDRVTFAPLVVNAIDIDRWNASQLSVVSDQAGFVPVLERKLCKLGRPELAEAPAMALIRNSTADHWPPAATSLVHLSHTLRLGSAEGTSAIVAFLERAIGKKWLGIQYATRHVGPLAGSIFALWCSQDVDVLRWFQTEDLVLRLRKVFEDSRAIDIKAFFNTLCLLGCSGLFGVPTDQITIVELPYRWEHLWDAMPGESDGLEFNNVQKMLLWLGLRELARLYNEYIDVPSAIGQDALEFWEKVEPSSDRMGWLREQMIEWLQRCDVSGWVLLSDDMSMAKRFALTGSGRT